MSQCKIPKHPYCGDGVPDVFGKDRCADCGLPESRDVHDLPQRAPDEVELAGRMVGEPEDGRG